jgi:hypothetical protein
MCGFSFLITGIFLSVWVGRDPDLTGNVNEHMVGVTGPINKPS